VRGGVSSSFRLKNGGAKLLKLTFLKPRTIPLINSELSPIELFVSAERCLEHYLHKVVLKLVLPPCPACYSVGEHN